MYEWRYGKLSFEGELSIDEGAVKRRSGRCMELAALFKEVGEGSVRTKNKILAKFRLQEGVKKKTSLSYFDDLVDVGLIKFFQGNKKWKYNPKAEWDLFHIEIV